MSVAFEGEVGAGYLTLYVIYDHPKDFPNHFVVRRNHVNGTYRVVDSFCHVVDTIEQARECIPQGLYRFDRDESDDPVIVETWM